MAFLRAISARSENHDPKETGIPNRKKTAPKTDFSAKPITQSIGLVLVPQEKGSSSRTTTSAGRFSPLGPLGIVGIRDQRSNQAQ
jgi:hypothetical protein